MAPRSDAFTNLRAIANDYQIELRALRAPRGLEAARLEARSPRLSPRTSMMALQVPSQLKNVNSGWFSICYAFLKKLAAASGSSSGNGGAPNVFVYREGGVADPANGIYTDMLSAILAAQAAAFAAPYVEVDGSLGVPVMKPGVSYPIAGIMFSSPTGQFATLTVEDGAVLDPSPNAVGCFGCYFERISVLCEATSAPSCSITSGGFFVSVTDGASIGTTAPATQPLFDVSGGAQFVLSLTNDATFASGNAAPTLAWSGPGTGNVEVTVGEFSTLGTNSLEGPSLNLNAIQTAVSAVMQPQAGVPSFTYQPALGPTVFEHVDVTLVAGSGTVASGLNLAEATLLGVTLVTAGSTGVGTPAATFLANGSVTVTSFAANGTADATDNSTWRVLFAGAQ